MCGIVLLSLRDRVCSQGRVCVKTGVYGRGFLEAEFVRGMHAQGKSLPGEPDSMASRRARRVLPISPRRLLARDL